MRVAELSVCKFMSACSDQVHLGSPLLGVVDALLLSVALFPP